MLSISAYVLAVTAMGGLALLALYQWVRPVGWWRLPGLGHGLLGLTGFGLLLAALGGPARGIKAGAGSFGLIAAALVAGAIAAAATAWLARRRGSAVATLALGLHATLAVAGLTMLAAYLSFPP
jgi:hypothetical protein